MSRGEAEGLCFGAAVTVAVMLIGAVLGAVAAGATVVMCSIGVVLGFRWSRKRQRRHKVR